MSDIFVKTPKLKKNNTLVILFFLIHQILFFKFIRSKENSHEEWTWYFIVNAVILFYINLPFLLYGRSKEQLWYHPDEVAQRLNKEYDIDLTTNEREKKPETSLHENYVDSVILQRNSDRRKHLSRLFPTHTIPNSIMDASAEEDSRQCQINEESLGKMGI